jgi:predicted metal-binding protein
MEFKVTTPNNHLTIEVYSNFIKKEEIKLDQQEFIELCKKCRNYGKKYSCPPKSPNFNNLCNKEGLYILLLKINLQDIKSTEYNKVQLANSILKSRVDKIMRLLEKQFNTKFLSSGSCRLCKPCNLQRNLPYKHPKEMRFSLESTGIDCNFLSQKLFDFPLLWFKDKKAPEYTCVLAGLICNQEKTKEIKEELLKALKQIIY